MNLDIILGGLVATVPAASLQAWQFHAARRQAKDAAVREDQLRDHDAANRQRESRQVRYETFTAVALEVSSFLRQAGALSSSGVGRLTDRSEAVPLRRPPREVPDELLTRLARSTAAALLEARDDDINPRGFSSREYVQRIHDRLMEAIEEQVKLGPELAGDLQMADLHELVKLMRIHVSAGI